MRIITIGRSSENDIVIKDAKVSRIHLQLVINDSGEYSIVDLNSANGTYVNGKRISGEVNLRPHDTVRIGDTTIPWTEYARQNNISLKSGNINPVSAGKSKKKGNKTVIWIALSVLVILLLGGVGYALYKNNAKQKRIKEEQEQVLQERERLRKEAEEKEANEILNLIEQANQAEMAGLRSQRDKSMRLANVKSEEAESAQRQAEVAKAAQKTAEDERLKAQEEAQKAREEAEKAKENASKNIQDIEGRAKKEVNSANKERDAAKKKAELIELFYSKYISLSRKSAQQICELLKIEIPKGGDAKVLIKEAFDKENNDGKQKIIDAIGKVEKQNSDIALKDTTNTTQTPVAAEQTKGDE